MVESKTLPGAVEAYGIDEVRRYIDSFAKYWEEIRLSLRNSLTRATACS